MTADAPDNNERWKRFSNTHTELIKARMDLFRCNDLVELVRGGLLVPHERAAALDVARLLELEQKKAIFPDLVALSTFVHGLTDDAIVIIMSLPRDWVIASIEPIVESLLTDASHEEYRMALRIYAGLSTILAQKLALRAMSHSDPDIKEAGKDWLAQLNDQQR